MLNERPATPRPIAPARARRKSLKVPASGSVADSNGSPPPPYVRQGADAGSRIEDLLGSPLSMTSQMVEYFNNGRSPGGVGSPAPERWVDEQSQGELRNLLVRAEETISERENELSWTSNVCKELYQENKHLKDKHQTLIARLPSSPAWSPAGSPRDSALLHVPSPSISSLTLHSHLDSLSASQSSPTLALPRPHARRISVSPAELSQLADQNAELLHKLESLENESANADLAGRRKLRALEKEIDGLRAELENTRARSAEIEDQARKRVEAAVRQRERQQPRRRRESESQTKVQAPDFAPACMFVPQTPSRPAAARRRVTSSPLLPALVSPTPARGLLHIGTSPTAKAEPSPTDPFRSPSVQSPSHQDSKPSIQEAHIPPESSPLPGEREHEYDVVSQLLSKIRELEETNAQIAAQQRDTGTRLRTAQRDTASISRLYSVLSGDDDADVEVVLDEGVNDGMGPLEIGSPSRDPTIRFQSLRRTIEGDMARADADPFFEAGIQPDMRSTMNGGHKLLQPKPRGTVVGLFDPLEEEDASDDIFDLSLNSSPAMARRLSLVGLDGVDPSQVLSPTSLEPNWSRFGSPSALPGHSLGSELGSECGDDDEVGPRLGLSGENHHLHTTSLYGLAQFQEDLSLQEGVSGSPSEGSIFAVTDAMFQSKNAPMVPPIGPVIIPPTPQSLRNRRLNTVVRSRVDRWDETRFGSLKIKPSTPRSRTPSAAETVTGTPRPTTTTFLRASLDAVADELVGEIEDDEIPDGAESAQLNDACSETAVEDDDQGTAMAQSLTSNKRKGVANVAMELFLWIQFILIILVFVLTMVRRGPHVFDKRRERS